ncbi:MAG TPA: metalloregulator ArsR/SmtB family transcription factor [Longimicrobiales bacterium]
MHTIAAHNGRAETLAQRFRALADPKRLRILELLCAGERCVCELTEALELGQSLLSFHLRTLKDAGLVRDRREGRWVYYALEPACIGELHEVLAALDAAAQPQLPPGVCCG